MSAWLFPEIYVATLTDFRYGQYKIDIATQSRSTYATPDFTSPLVATSNPFIDIPEVANIMEPEVGAFGANPGTFLCNNFAFEAGGTRMSDIIEGSYPLDTALHLRLHWKPKGGAYSIMFWGTIQVSDDNITMPNPDDKDTWKIKFSVVDCIMQLDDYPVSSTFLATIPIAGYSPSNIVVTWGESGVPTTAVLSSIPIDDGATKFNINPNELRFVKLYDVVQAISDAIGITSAVVVNHTWQFFTRGASADVTNTWDNLYIVRSALHNAVLIQYPHMFFHPESSISFYDYGTLLEMLKALLIPFGLVARVQSSAGVRYLEISELQSASGITINVNAMERPVSVNPSERVLYGMIVNTKNGGETIIGSSGDGATAISNTFLSLNGLKGIQEALPYDEQGVPTMKAVFGSLYALDGTVMRSVYKITVRTYAQTGASGNNITYDYDDSHAWLVVGKACAVYYCNVGASTTSDKIGIYRRIQRRMEFVVQGIIDKSTLEPTHSVTFRGLKWWIMEKAWDFKSGKTKFIAETGEW